MAVFFDKYEIALKVDGNDTEVDPSLISFSIKDSIHNLYPTFLFEIKDYIGGWQEYLLTAESIPLEISYGLNDDYITCPFVLTSEEVTKLLSNTHISGNNLVNAVHSYFETQEIKSAGYKNRISTIIEGLVASFNFKKLNINGTSNDTYWYQPLITDADFMADILLPNAFSYNRKESPIFLYIGSDNSFNLKSYSAMVESKPVKKLFYLHENLKDLKDNVVTSFRKFKTGSEITKYTRNREVYQFSKTDGTLIKSADGITSYPEVVNKKLPIYKNNAVTSFIDLGKEEIQTGRTENKKGLKLSSMKDSLFIERLLITTYLDSSLLAGNTIELDIPHFKSTNNDEKSQYFSGIYLIEEAEQVWDSTGDGVGRGYTQLLLSRKYLNNLPASNYNIAPKLFTS